MRPTTRRASPIGLAACSLAAAAAASGCAGGARAPARPGSRVIDRLEGSARVESQYERRSTSGSGTDERLQVVETAGLKAKGHVYDPKLLLFALGGTLAQSQESTLSPPGMRTRPLTSWSSLLDLLPTHPYTGTFYADEREERSIVWSGDATPVLRSQNRDLGGNLRYGLAPLYARASFRRSESRNETFDGERRLERDTTDLGLRHEPGALFRTELSFERDEVRERDIQDLAYRTEDASAENTIYVGPPDARSRAEFRTGARSVRRIGALDTRDDRVWEQVELRPRDDLDSTTRFERSTHGDGTRVVRDDGRQQFVHRLFDSLTTSLEASHSRDTFGEGGSEQWSSTLRLDYRKQTALGLLNVAMERGKERRANDVPQATLPVRDESHALRDDTLVLLEQSDVVLASVVVADSDGVVIFTKGLDYELVPRGRRVELVRRLGGNIADGATVLVDYDYAPVFARSIATRRRGLSGSLLVLDLLRLYGRTDRTTQSARPEAATRELEQLDSRTVGAELTWEGWRLLGEVDDHLSSLTSYRQERAEASYASDPMETSLWGGANLTAMRTSFAEGDDLRVGSVRCQVATRLGYTGVVRLEPGYRVERGRSEDRNRFDLLLSANYSYGEIRFVFELRHLIDRSESRRDSQTTIEISVERRW